MKNSLKHSKPLLFTIISLWLLLVPTLSFAIESHGLGGFPANPDPDNPATIDWFIYEMEPGDSLTDEVVVVNNTLEAKTIEIYAADQTPSAGGGVALKQKVEEMDEVGSWVSVKTKEVDLEPGESTIVSFSVKTPRSISPGDYVGGVVIQEVKPPELTGGIALSTRMAVRMYITVPGDIIENIHFLGIENHSLSRFKDLKSWKDIFRSYDIISLTVQNEGTVNHDVVAQISVENMFGGLITQFTDLQFQVLKNSTYEWNARWKTPWLGGPYKIAAEVEIETRNDKIVKTDAIWVWIWPEWWVLLTLVLLILLITWVKISGYSISIAKAEPKQTKKNIKKKNVPAKRVTRKDASRSTTVAKKSTKKKGAAATKLKRK